MLKKFLKDEFITGKKWYDWLFLLIGLIMQTFAIIYGFISGEPESFGMIISGLTGVLSVILCSQQKISFYLFGFIQLFTYVFCFTLPNALHGETIENGMYFITMIYGLFIWIKNYKKDAITGAVEVKAKHLGWKGNTITASIFVIGTLLYWQFLKRVPMFGKYDTQPFIDSITSIPAYIAQYFMILGYREQWIYWLILDVFSVILALRAGSYIMTAQFIFWTINCIYGWILWSRQKEYIDIVN